MVTIVTRRVVLREFTHDDFAAIHRYASNPNVVQFMLWGPNTEEDTHRFLHKAIQDQMVKPRITYDLAITLNGKLIGGAGTNIRDLDNGETEIGYCLDEPYWRKGLATELTGALIKYSFEELEMHRVFAKCDAENIGSYRVMEKNGMKREGILRENLLIRGIRRNTLIYSILRHEWSPSQSEDITGTYV